jgi:hypothetical protein
MLLPRSGVLSRDVLPFRSSRPSATAWGKGLFEAFGPTTEVPLEAQIDYCAGGRAARSLSLSDNPLAAHAVAQGARHMPDGSKPAIFPSIRTRSHSVYQR